MSCAWEATKCFLTLHGLQTSQSSRVDDHQVHARRQLLCVRCGVRCGQRWVCLHQQTEVLPLGPQQRRYLHLR